jgi:hypothetical protein
MKHIQPFQILLAGNPCVTKCIGSWKNGADSTTWVYSVPFNRETPSKYLAVYSAPIHAMNKHTGAIIRACYTNVPVMGDSYFVGTLTPDKSSTFVQHMPKRPLPDGITFYVIIMPLPSVLRYSSDHKAGRLATGPFTELNSTDVDTSADVVSDEADASVGPV